MLQEAVPVHVLTLYLQGEKGEKYVKDFESEIKKAENGAES